MIDDVRTPDSFFRSSRTSNDVDTNQEEESTLPGEGSRNGLP